VAAALNRASKRRKLNSKHTLSLSLMQDLECTQISPTTKNAYEVREATSDPEKILRCEGLPSNPTLIQNYIAKTRSSLATKIPLDHNKCCDLGGSLEDRSNDIHFID